MDEILTGILLTLQFMIRLVLVPVLNVLTATVYGVLRLAYWFRTRDRIALVYLAIPPYRYQRWCEAWSALHSSDSSKAPATAMLDDALRADPTAWKAVLRKKGYVPPVDGEPVVPESQNHNFMFHALLRRGARYMVFERERLAVDTCVPMRVTSRSDWRERGIVSIGDIFGTRCELREPSATASRYAPTVSVGDRVSVRIVESRGRTAVAELADSGQQEASVSERIETKRETYMVVASPWIYLELSLGNATSESVCIVQEIYAPSCQDVPEDIQKNQRLVVRNGRRLSPTNLLLLGTTELLMARSGPIDPAYPLQQELVFPSAFTVVAAVKALGNTIGKFAANRRQNHRCWNDVFTSDVAVGPSTLFRRAVLFDEDVSESDAFWARHVGNALLHFAPNGSDCRPIDLLVKPKAHLNAKAETYYWLERFSKGEPRRITNATRRWWISKGGLDD